MHGIAMTHRPGCAPTGQKKNRDDLLTVEKTVIRFRRNTRRNESSESNHDTSAQHNPDLCQEHHTVDAGIVSAAKSLDHSFRPSRRIRRARVFASPGRRRAVDDPPFESGPTRGARRRLCAGPTPACRLRTGPLYMQVH